MSSKEFTIKDHLGQSHTADAFIGAISFAVLKKGAVTSFWSYMRKKLKPSAS